MRTFYYFWKYARIFPSDIYKLKREKPMEYKLLRVFLIQEIEDKIDEKRYSMCPMFGGEE